MQALLMRQALQRLSNTHSKPRRIANCSDLRHRRTATAKAHSTRLQLLLQATLRDHYSEGLMRSPVLVSNPHLGLSAQRNKQSNTR